MKNCDTIKRMKPVYGISLTMFIFAEPLGKLSFVAADTKLIINVTKTACSRTMWKERLRAPQMQGSDRLMNRSDNVSAELYCAGILIPL